MCLILIASGVHPEYPLLIAANRDEFYAREAAPAHWWEQEWLAGKDLKEGGTWLGVTRAGRFAAVTNYRDLRNHKTAAPSRGGLVTGFLNARQAPGEWLSGIQPADQYNGFNFLFGMLPQLFVFSNVAGGLQLVPQGLHALSNAFLNTPWFKSVQAKEKLTALLQTGVTVDLLFSILADREQAPDSLLPDTGLPFEMEKQISSAFISFPGYGTRCSTVITLNTMGEVTFQERTFTTQGTHAGTAAFSFTLAKE